MRWTRSWTVAATLLTLSLIMYAWSAVETVQGRREHDACVRSHVWLAEMACMNFDGMAQAYAGFGLFLGAASAAAWGGWKLHRAGRPARERVAIDREIADIDVEIDALNRRDS